MDSGEFQSSLDDHVLKFCRNGPEALVVNFQIVAISFPCTSVANNRFQQSTRYRSIYNLSNPYILTTGSAITTLYSYCVIRKSDFKIRSDRLHVLISIYLIIVAWRVTRLSNCNNCTFNGRTLWREAENSNHCLRAKTVPKFSCDVGNGVKIVTIRSY